MDNNKIINALRKVKETQWVGELTFFTMDECLRSINFSTNNGGLYDPKAIKIEKVKGHFLVNKDNSIFYDARIIKKDDGKFKIEWLSNSGYDAFENAYKLQN